MSNKPPRIVITFKKDELDLYNWALKKSCKAGFIKDILYEVKKEEEAKNS